MRIYGQKQPLKSVCENMVLNPFHVSSHLLYPLKTSENQRVFDACRGGYRKRPVTWNRLTIYLQSRQGCIHVKNLEDQCSICITQSDDMHCLSIDWFLYGGSNGRNRVQIKMMFTSQNFQSMFGFFSILWKKGLTQYCYCKCKNLNCMQSPEKYCGCGKVRIPDIYRMAAPQLGRYLEI